MNEPSHEVEDGGDGPALSSEFGERYEGICRDYRQSIERGKDAFVLKRPSFFEPYIKGRMWIAVEFRAHPVTEADSGTLLSVWHHDGNFLEAAPCGFAVGVKEVEPFHGHDSIGPDKNMVLVSNVEGIHAVKLAPTVLKWLYLIKDEPDYFGAGESVCFLSLQEAFRTLPGISEGKFAPTIDRVAVGLDESAVCVVEGSAKVVDGITDDGRCMLRETPAKGSLFPTVRIGLGTHGFDVVHHVSSENRFQLVDVMVGPFYF